MIDAVTVPEGSCGDWSVQLFTISEDEARWANVRASIKGRGGIRAGTYTKLVHARRGIIMSDTPDERRDHFGPVMNATGDVLITGLGLGMVLAAVLKQPGVETVTVVEIDPDVIALVGTHYAADPRVKIINANAFEYKPEKGARFGVVWHDIWDNLCADNLPQMTRIKRRYGRFADWQGCWGENFIRRRLA